MTRYDIEMKVSAEERRAIKEKRAMQRREKLPYSPHD